MLLEILHSIAKQADAKSFILLLQMHLLLPSATSRGALGGQKRRLLCNFYNKPMPLAKTPFLMELVPKRCVPHCIR